MFTKQACGWKFKKTCNKHQTQQNNTDIQTNKNDEEIEIGNTFTSQSRSRKVSIDLAEGSMLYHMKIYWMHWGS